jgi:hypothetical protein
MHLASVGLRVRKGIGRLALVALLARTRVTVVRVRSAARLFEVFHVKFNMEKGIYGVPLP